MILKHTISTGERRVSKYPRHDMKPIKDLDKDIEFYDVHDNMPDYDPETHSISFIGYSLTKERSTEYPHLNIAYREYSVNEIIIQEYVIEKRLKDVEDAVKALAKKPDERTITEIENIEKITLK